MLLSYVRRMRGRRKEQWPGGKWTVGVFVLACVALLVGPLIGLRAVTVDGLDCGSPWDPAYESFGPADLSADDWIVGPPAETQEDRERAVCDEALIAPGAWSIGLALGGFVVGCISCIMLLMTRPKGSLARAPLVADLEREAAAKAAHPEDV
jgi:hypothetical protein